ncbi:MAG TPA: hypothetical protein VF060_09970 [Trebonia sp.]
MEVLIGFAFGYWVGTRQGREGMQRVLDSAREIWESPEARRLVGEGLSTVQGAAQAAPISDVIRKAGSSRRRAMIRDVLDEIVERRFGRQSTATAA